MKKKNNDDMIQIYGPIRSGILSQEELDRKNPYRNESKRMIEKKKKKTAK